MKYLVLALLLAELHGPVPGRGLGGVGPAKALVGFEPLGHAAPAAQLLHLRVPVGGRLLEGRLGGTVHRRRLPPVEQGLAVHVVLVFVSESGGHALALVKEARVELLLPDQLGRPRGEAEGHLLRHVPLPLPLVLGPLELAFHVLHAHLALALLAALGAHLVALIHGQPLVVPPANAPLLPLVAPVPAPGLSPRAPAVVASLRLAFRLAWRLAVVPLDHPGRAVVAAALGEVTP
mmetsp:Transcript_62146/g.140576  ORF Transcript_62146/g.140576 Transcript_62146/m.140576 type:complete len:234 (-) Transcript_62146:1155-1856(-)